jgi:hypothetical protein
LGGAHAISQIDPFHQLDVTAWRLCVCLEQRAHIASRHVETAEDIVKETGAIERIDFDTQPAASLLNSSPLPCPAEERDKATPKPRCAEG